jgi:glucose-6-phosphate 1-dehydrogenase
VIQNHLLQVLAILAMEPPTGEESDAILHEKARVLRAIRPLSANDAVRGQFKGYRAEPGVAPDSQVETYAAVRLFVDNWRWADVPFYIRSGKCLPVTCTEVVVNLKRPPRQSFAEDELGAPNRIRLRLSPEVVIALCMRVKTPGEQMEGEEAELIATHQGTGQMTPYERLLGEALEGDQSLFASETAIEAQWRIVQPILTEPTPLYPYDPHTWGPPEADLLIGEDGGWLNPRQKPRDGNNS